MIKSNIKNLKKCFFLLCIIMITFTSCDLDDVELNDLSPEIQGTYKGSGYIREIGSYAHDQSYSTVYFEIKRIGYNKVVVTPYDYDGCYLFPGWQDFEFRVVPHEDGYELLHSEGPDASFIITTDGQMSLYFPYMTVNEQEGYEFIFNGEYISEKFFWS